MRQIPRESPAAQKSQSMENPFCQDSALNPESTKQRNRKLPRFSVANVPNQTAMGTLFPDPPTLAPLEKKTKETPKKNQGFCLELRKLEKAVAVPGSVRGFSRKIPGKSRENSRKFFPNHEMLQILGFRAPGKANLPGTLGPHCRDLVPTFRAGFFLKSTVPAFSSFSDLHGTPRIIGKESA